MEAICIIRKVENYVLNIFISTTMIKDTCLITYFIFFETWNVTDDYVVTFIFIHITMLPKKQPWSWIWWISILGLYMCIYVNISLYIYTYTQILVYVFIQNIYHASVISDKLYNYIMLQISLWNLIFI